ncbi:MAG: hypothetical protein ACKVOU_13260 [Cytophagales bacterium]
MPPVNTGASSVVFYRHLKLLEQDGYKISVVVNEIGLKNANSEIPKSWNTFVLPNRKWWYPPYKPTGLLKKVRYYLIYLKLFSFIKSNKPNIVIGCLYGIYLSGFCAFLSQFLNIKLFMFYHDRAELLNYHGNQQMQKIIEIHNFEIINQSTKIWTVSEQLVYQKKGWENKFQVIYPIPEKLNFAAPIWKENFAIAPIIGYAGTLYNEVVEIMIVIAKILKQLNGKLLILTNQTENVEKIKKQCDNIIYEQKSTTYDACKYIYENCNAFLVAYPEKTEQMPWIDSCFPSKFTQFIHTGLPIIVVAPEDAAISIWCQKSKWEGYSSQFESKKLKVFLQLLSQKENWLKLSNQSQAVSQHFFDPDKIHTLISKDIL